MRYPTFILVSLFLLLTACGNDQVAKTDDTTAPSTEPGPFAPAAEALAAGKSSAVVGSLLMQHFPAVSDPETGLVDRNAGEAFVSIAEKLATEHPGDTLAALPLYRAAEVVRALNDPARTAAIYARVHEEFPTFSKAPESLFMLAFTYDEDMDDLARAKRTYEQFIAAYPRHGFADDAQMLLGNLGKSDEEILRELEEKAAGQ